MKKRIIVVLNALLFILLLTGCMGKTGNNNSSESENNIDNDIDPEDISDFEEAPELKELVDEGDLDSVEDRLPVEEDIMVEDVYEEIGSYGGDINIAWEGADSKWTVGKYTEEPLFRFTEDGETVEPNVAKGYDVNEEATEYTIYLREGMKWSDGVPFTTDDVIFFWEHMLKEETFGKSVYDAFYSVDPETNERKMAEITQLDDYSFKVTFDAPSPNFLTRLAIDSKWFFAPKHFHETILPEFVGDEKASEIADENGYPDVSSYLKDTGYYYWIREEIPTLRPWVASNDPHSDVFVMERNPYYWKVDAEGNQLPYTDNIKANKIQDASQSVLSMLGEDINIGVFGTEDITVLKENEERSNYRVLLWPTANLSETMIQLNQTVEDDNLRELFQDIRFREALSLAVDRYEISETVTNGMAEPSQASIPEGLVGYQEGWEDHWSDYDQERAEQLLDEIGLTEKNDKGFRLFEDDSVVTLTITEPETEQATFLELLQNYYEKVGIKVDLKYVDDGTYQDLKYSNQIEATAENAFVVNVALRPDVLLPLRVLTPWQGDYGLYNETDGENGTKPEGDIAKLMEYWDKLRASTTEEETMEWADEIYKLHMQNQWIIGYTSSAPNIIAAAESLRNVPEELIFADEFRDVGHAHPAQFFIKE
ncbi:MAG TPA: ABC transporter substrate-binding protein [Virgibacillus sp.]|nr:ABC transporter substrate-binding protein [Virgibacillus sp.]